MDSVEISDSQNRTDAKWFRAPTPREHRIAAALFVGFGLFFILLFILQRGWWFRWVMLLLGITSIVRGLLHAARSKVSPR